MHSLARAAEMCVRARACFSVGMVVKLAGRVAVCRPLHLAQPSFCLAAAPLLLPPLCPSPSIAFHSNDALFCPHACYAIPTCRPVFQRPHIHAPSSRHQERAPDPRHSHARMHARTRLAFPFRLSVPFSFLPSSLPLLFLCRVPFPLPLHLLLLLSVLALRLPS